MITKQFSSAPIAFLGAYRPGTDVSSFKDLDLEEVVNCVHHLGRLRTTLGWHATERSLLPLAQDRWRGAATLLGSICESLQLTPALVVEMDYNSRARGSGDLEPVMVLAYRFFAESLSQRLVEVGHRLINLTVRLLAIEPSLRAALEASNKPPFRKAASEPFVDGRSHWISLNQSTAQSLTSVAELSKHESVLALSRQMLILAQSPEWDMLVEQRAKDFHRHRVESSVMAGIDSKSGPLRDVLDLDGGFIGREGTSEIVRYETGDDVERRVATTATKALLRLTEETAKYLSHLEVAIEPLSRGRLRLEGNSLATIYGIWNEGECRCCATPPEGP